VSGLLIAVEGPDGAGRTSQTRAIEEWLAARGHEVTLLRLKHSSLARETLQSLQRRMDVSERALFLLYLADLADLLHTEAAPALAEGRVVLFDRYTLTPRVRAQMHGLEPEWLRDALAFAPPADLTILLEAPARERLRRLFAHRRFLQPREIGALAPTPDLMTHALRYQRRLGRLYAEAADEPGVVRIDAAQPPGLVQEAVRQEVERLLRRKARARGRAT
jgi:dTMP kinase